jgi:hypothetical protein
VNREPGDSLPDNELPGWDLAEPGLREVWETDDLSAFHG